MTQAPELTDDRDWLIDILTVDQEQLLSDYDVHADVWKGDPDRTDGIAVQADAILERLNRRTSAAPADDALREELEKWKRAFAAQSRKLQSVLHIEGVRAALSEDRT